MSHPIYHAALRCLPGSAFRFSSKTRHAFRAAQHEHSVTWMALPIRSGSVHLMHRRMFLTETLPPFLVPPTIFTGLFLGLWAYKCFMTVVFQEKFIYMPYMPPFARSEKIAAYAGGCLPVHWKEEIIESLDGTKLVLVVGSIPDSEVTHKIGESTSPEISEIIVCYFQGNGSSTPPRLPLLSHVLRLLHDGKTGKSTAPRGRYTIVALSYRGYWKSSGRASQTGIEHDTQALMAWIANTYDRALDADKLAVIPWGQSIGAGIAATAVALHKCDPRGPELPISALILETPFTSVKSMLFALYPQKWLPYQYLWPFLRNHWDSEEALRSISMNHEKPKILVVAATRDEVVPPEEADKIVNLCTELNFQVERKSVYGALHTEATTRREGQQAVAEFIQKVTAARSQPK